MKTHLRSLLHKIKGIGENPYLFCIILGFLLNFGVELLGRKDLVSAFSYLTGRPVIFIYNSMAIAFTVSVALLTRRRIFAFSAMAMLWLSVGVVNSLVLVFRTTPFTAADLTVVKSAFAVMNSYLTTSQICGIIIGIVVLIVLAVILFRKAPKRKERIPYRNVVGYIGGLFLIVYFSTLAGMDSGILASRFGNIADAYLEYGFPYCFGNSLLNTGIEKPTEYSEEIVDELIAEVEKPVTHMSYLQGDTEAVKEAKPNIIFLQLESFFDPAHVEGVEFSKNPLPNFTTLRETETSGYLNVPSVGAGTVNTEFEVITGMNLDFFGPGEYPYKTVLKETTCESIAYNLREEGYKSHIIHNNTATFYERNEILPQLGFDRFVSLEYMYNEETTYAGWAMDEILITEIRKALASTEEQDVIYAISVQGHGSYPIAAMENPMIKVTGLEEQEHNSFEYYVNQLYEMDKVILALTKTLEEYEEDVILVLYGDHLPGFDFTEEELKNGNIYQTEYIIWSNYGLEEKDKDLEAYQLSAYVLKQAGLHNGILTKYHQNFSNEEDYLESLELLQYDMLYGDREVYDGENPYEPSQMIMGTNQPLLYEVSRIEDTFRLRGGHFTKYSCAAINGRCVETEYVNNYTLLIREQLKDGDIITIHQLSENEVSLSETEGYTYYE